MQKVEINEKFMGFMNGRQRRKKKNCAILLNFWLLWRNHTHMEMVFICAYFSVCSSQLCKSLACLPLPSWAANCGRNNRIKAKIESETHRHMYENAVYAHLVLSHFISLHKTREICEKWFSHFHTMMCGGWADPRVVRVALRVILPNITLSLSLFLSRSRLIRILSETLLFDFIIKI